MSETELPPKPTAKSRTSRRRAFQASCMLLSGLAIGWMIGLSASPVLHLVVSSMITLIASVASLLAGLDISRPLPQGEVIADKPQRASTSRVKALRINPLPMALLLIGMAIGASVGVLARANEWLGANPSMIANKWRSTGYSNEEISRRVFDDLYPGTTGPAASSVPSTSPSPSASLTPPAQSNSSPKADQEKVERPLRASDASPHSGFLFTSREKECARLLAADHGEDLRRAMAGSPYRRIRNMANKILDDNVLRNEMREKICPDFH